MTKTYVEFWNAIETWKVLDVTTVNGKTSAVPWTSYQSATKHTFDTCIHSRFITNLLFRLCWSPNMHTQFLFDQCF